MLYTWKVESSLGAVFTTATKAQIWAILDGISAALHGEFVSARNMKTGEYEAAGVAQ